MNSVLINFYGTGAGTLLYYITLHQGFQLNSLLLFLELPFHDAILCTVT